MLVGDYCPRALDPINEVLEAEKRIKAKHMVEEKEKEREEAEAPSSEVIHAKRSCNVFGSFDICDGMGCEDDGNCNSGCCAIFVPKDDIDGEDTQKRCMPLVNGNMCPVSVDEISPTKADVSLPIASTDFEEDIDEDEEEYQRDHTVM